MSMADRPDLGFAWRLNRGLKRIACAQTKSEALLATVQSAHELARADGLCVLPQDYSQCLVAIVNDANVVALDGNSPLQRLVASAVGNAAIVQHRPHLEVELPSGRRLRAETLLTVPLGPDSGYLALGFFWQNEVRPSTEQLSLLPGIAWTCCLALRSQQWLEELRDTRERQRSQLAELQHRARNVLALVRSIIRRSGDLAESQEEFASHLEARISALARTLGALTIDGETGPELEDLLRAELIANAAREAQFAIAGPSLRLSMRAAETIALTLHELTTNSLKFGALTAPSGRIEVSWTIEPAPAMLRWRWHESGVSIVQAATTRRGFGRELIERVLPYELGATTRFTIAPGGMHCEIDLPLNERTAAAGARQQETSGGELV